MKEVASETVESAVFAEAVALVVRSPMRVIGAGGLVAVLLGMSLTHAGPVGPAVLPLAAGYLAYALVVHVVRNATPGLQRRTHVFFGYAMAGVDIPFAAAVGAAWAHAAPSPDSVAWACGMSTGGCLCNILFTGLYLERRRFLLVSATSALLVLTLLFVSLRQPWGRLAMAVMFVAVTTGGVRMLVRLGITLVRRAAELAEARVKEAEERARELEASGREIGQLNAELQHQVAERSRELTEALARIEGRIAPASLELGDMFDGRYRVTRALGRGGMGAVYEVERVRDGRRLALKVVTSELSGRAAARFAREAEIGARLRHPNVVSILDVGVAARGTPFLVMELVHGGSMEEQRGRFGDAGWALPLLRQIATGLGELHANRIVHRDLKPANVLLLDGSGSPVAKISDFGISRFGALDDSGEVDAESKTADGSARDASPRDLTQTGALMGTPVYMPPEAWFGPARHPSADLFSFGILAYEALTGRAPFAVPPIVLVRARQPIPDPAPFDGVSERVASLVLACLRAEPAERPRAKDVAEGM